MGQTENSIFSGEGSPNSGQNYQKTLKQKLKLNFETINQKGKLSLN